MKSSHSTEFSAADGRRFAFPVGTAFLLLAALLLWRGRGGAANVVGGLGVVLFLAGLVVPSRLGSIYRAWMAMALMISKVTTPIFMGVVYFVVLTPTGLLMRLIGRNPMVHEANKNSYWFDVADGKSSSGDMRRQF